ncbi:hypothetical protein ACH5RR_033645 [Cinchona calisaya]|uniref:Uncharacterized protein n=1 Tax=Cinchona calisaya TaxID=153742 RepID=A0ABD2Y8J2_9GENT
MKVKMVERKKTRVADGNNRVELTINLLGQIWKARNRVTFDKADTDGRIVIRQAQQEWVEFKKANLIVKGRNNGIIVHDIAHKKWTPPELGILRINTATIVEKHAARGSAGIVIKDSNGELVSANGRLFKNVKSGKILEAKASRWALTTTKDEE